MFFNFIGRNGIIRKLSAWRSAEKSQKFENLTLKKIETWQKYYLYKL